MFIEFKTQKNELVSLNVAFILYVTEYEKGCVIYDTEGMEYTVSEEYSSFMARLNSKNVKKRIKRIKSRK